MQADDGGILPGQLQAGTGRLHCGDVGMDYHPVSPQDLHHQGADAIKIGVAGGQHHHPQLGGQGGKLGQGAFRVLAQEDLFRPG